MREPGLRPLLLAVASLLPPASLSARAADWIVIAGGSEPASTQVSLEQDADLARQVFPGHGAVLFAGGAHAPAVQVRDGSVPRDALRLELGDIFDPRDGREARYRPPRIRVDGKATLETVRRRLETALRSGTAPLLVYVAAHGEQGEEPRDNGIRLWGGRVLAVADLATMLDAHPQREVRLVMTSCYAGGFAEIVFTDADPQRGAARGLRCGLFAAPWDELAAGCDPDPDRSRQEGYGLHFLHALRGEDRDGRRLAGEEVDFDGDGRVSLLEAHTRARIASRSFDIPTTTSERWLRHAAPRRGPRKAVDLPEERAVIRALSARLGVRGARLARQLRDRLAMEWEQARERADQAAAELDDAAADLAIALLERWPVLDDPWHPLFPQTWRRGRTHIRKFLHDSPLAARYRTLRRRADELAAAADGMEARRALAERLVRAHETTRLAERLAAAGGPGWETYRRLLGCERSVPGPAGRVGRRRR